MSLKSSYDTYLRCAYHQCPTNTLPPEQRGIMFCFPRMDGLWRQWLEILDRREFFELTYKQLLNKKIRVCARHFNDKQFQTIKKEKLLRNQLPHVVRFDDTLTSPEQLASTSGQMPDVEVPTSHPCGVKRKNNGK
nr:uncharacterized protein LOC111425022 [Onthophagus taurus]